MANLKVSILTILSFASLVGCDKKETEKSSVPETAAPTPTPTSKRFTESDRVALMEEHYVVAIGAHDMLIAGDLERFRTQFDSLSSQELPSNAPEAWRAPHGHMQKAAETAKQAMTLEEAATSMAFVVQACGSCHAANPNRGPVYRQPSEPEGEDRTAKMKHHQWASERLWEGVTGPSDYAWSRGTAALAKSRVFAEGQGTKALLELEQKMRALGEDAKKLTVLADRAKLYGKLLASCGSCHQQMGIEIKGANH